MTFARYPAKYHGLRRMAEHGSNSRLKLRYLLPDLQEPASAQAMGCKLEQAAARRFGNVLYWKTDIMDPTMEEPFDSLIQMYRTEFGKATNGSSVGGIADSAGVAYKGAKKSLFSMVTGKKD